MLRLSQRLPPRATANRAPASGPSAWPGARVGMSRGPRRGCTEPPIRADGVAAGLRCRCASACCTVQIADITGSNCTGSGGARRRHDWCCGDRLSGCDLERFSRTRRNIPVASGAYCEAVNRAQRVGRHREPAARAGPGVGRRRGRESGPADGLICSVACDPGVRCDVQSTACGISRSCW